MTTLAPRAWTIARDNAGLILRVRLTPRSSREEVAGVEPTREGPALTAFVRAVPEDGRANAALESLIAVWLDAPKRAVSVIAGHKSRIKTVAIGGDPVRLSASLESRLDQPVAQARER